MSKATHKISLKKGLVKHINKTQKQAKTTQKATEDHIEKHLFNRFKRLFLVRRFLVLWIALIAIMFFGVLVQNYLLSNYYQRLEPVPGGVYNEGIYGNFTTTNPIFATNIADTSVSKLVFAPLLTYDVKGNLSPELASSYTLNSRGDSYRVFLKKNLTWQDGKPLTADDVVFTYNLIKNPDVRSPFQTYFSGVQIKSAGKYAVDFNLPSTLASFPNYLTIGILPAHILSGVSPQNLRASSFNTSNPIGSGPFEFKTIAVKGNDPSNEEVEIQLTPFNNFVFGKPKLDTFLVHAYASKNQLINAFSDGQLNAAEGLSVVPEKIQKNKSLVENSFILNAGTYLFLKNSNPILSDVKVRTAITESIDTSSLIDSLGYKTIPVNEPFLKNHIGYNPSYAQHSFDLANANKLLDQAGWTMQGNNIRSKNGQALSFNLTILDDDEYVNVANIIKKDLAQAGINLNITALDLNNLSLALEYHQYDSVLYSISIGNDSDVYVYWASSQGKVSSGTWTNLSEYNNANADKSLENARIRTDSTLRSIKYVPFLQAWQADQPAVGLYQPRDLYITDGKVFGLPSGQINSPADRLDNAYNFEIHQAKVTIL